MIFSLSEHLRLLVEALKENQSFEIHGDTLPCALSLNGLSFYVYVKNLSTAHFNPDGNVWRAQLPSRTEFEVIKTSEKPFIFLGYDEGTDTYATWDPDWVKSRQNNADYVSFYSRLSAQKKACETHEFVRQPLSNEQISLVFPRLLLGEFLLNINKYFAKPSTAQVILKDGKIERIVEKELLNQIEPYLKREYPQMIPAMNIVQQFYKGLDLPNMQLKDWMALLKNIDWNNPGQSAVPENSQEKLSRRPHFKFSMIGVQVGETVTFMPTNIEVKVVGDKQIEYEGRTYSLSGFAKNFMPKEMCREREVYQGPTLFSYKGVALDLLRDQKEGLA